MQKKSQCDKNWFKLRFEHLRQGNLGLKTSLEQKILQVLLCRKCLIVQKQQCGEENPTFLLQHKAQSVLAVCPEYHHLVDVSIHYHIFGYIFLSGQHSYFHHYYQCTELCTILLYDHYPIQLPMDLEWKMQPVFLQCGHVR